MSRRCQEVHSSSLSGGMKTTSPCKLTLLRWYRQCRFLPRTAPELDRHAAPAGRSAPAAPGKQTSDLMRGARNRTEAQCQVDCKDFPRVSINPRMFHNENCQVHANFSVSMCWVQRSKLNVAFMLSKFCNVIASMYIHTSGVQSENSESSALILMVDEILFNLACECYVYFLIKEFIVEKFRYLYVEKNTIINPMYSSSNINNCHQIFLFSPSEDYLKASVELTAFHW